MTPVFGPRQLGESIEGPAMQPFTLLAATFKVWSLTTLCLKLDFANASTVTVHRSDMLLSVRDRLPELCAFCLSLYSKPSFFVVWVACHRVRGGPTTRWAAGTAPFLFHHSFSHYFAELRPYVGLFGRSYSGWPSECGRRWWRREAKWASVWTPVSVRSFLIQT